MLNVMKHMTNINVYEKYPFDMNQYAKIYKPNVRLIFLLSQHE